VRARNDGYGCGSRFLPAGWAALGVASTAKAGMEARW
jgi:hypothetical protein